MNILQPRLLVILLIIGYLVMLFGGAMLKPDYSHFSQYISELNAITTPNASLIGWVGFMPFGILAALLIIVTSKYVPVVGISRFGYWLLLAEPIAYIGSTFFPCDVGCPLQGSESQFVHNALGGITYVATTIGLILLSFTPTIPIRWRVTWIAVAATWFSLFSMMLEPELANYRGILQRFAEWVVYGALLTCAWYYLGNKKMKDVS